MHRLIIVSAIVVAAGLTQSAIAHGQAPVAPRQTAMRGLDDVKSGAKLRVTTFTTTTTKFQGRFDGVHNYVLALRVDGAKRDVNISDILRLDEAYRDHRRGALVGVVPGIIGVYAWDFFGPHPRYRDQGLRYRENFEALGVTTVVGAILGAAIGWQRWRPLQKTAP